MNKQELTQWAKESVDILQRKFTKSIILDAVAIGASAAIVGSMMIMQHKQIKNDRNVVNCVKDVLNTLEHSDN